MDIFGRELRDYRHLMALRDAGLYDDQVRAYELEIGHPPHDFNALQRRLYGGEIISRVEGDAQAVGYLTNNLQAVHSMIEEILYTEFRLDEFVPIVTDVPEGAATYAFRVVDRVGLGDFIDFSGSNAPSAMVGVRLQPYPLHYAGIIAEWTLEDLRRAMFGGVALDSETIEAAVRGAMDHIERIGISGDDRIDAKGLINQTTGTGRGEIALTTLDDPFTEMTAELVGRTINGAVSDVIEASEEVYGRQLRMGMTIYVPTEQFNYLVSEPHGDNADRTIWDYVKMSNPWVAHTGNDLMLRSVIELKNGAVGGSTDRMVVAVNERRTMEMAIPIYPRIITTLQRGYSICAPLEYKLSPLNIKRPSAIRYYDNV